MPTAYLLFSEADNKVAKRIQLYLLEQGWTVFPLYSEADRHFEASPESILLLVTSTPSLSAEIRTIARKLPVSQQRYCCIVIGDPEDITDAEHARTFTYHDQPMRISNELTEAVLIEIHAELLEIANRDVPVYDIENSPLQAPAAQPQAGGPPPPAQPASPPVPPSGVVAAPARSVPGVSVLGSRLQTIGSVFRRHMPANSLTPDQDLVQFSVTAPAAVAPDNAYVLDAWAHLESEKSLVLRRASEAQRDRPTVATIPNQGLRADDLFTFLSVRWHNRILCTLR